MGLQQLRGHDPRKFAKISIIEFLTCGWVKRTVTSYYHALTTTNRETVQIFKFINFETLCSLKFTEYGATMVTWS